MELVVEFTMKYGPLAGAVIILLLIIWGLSLFILNIYQKKFEEFDAQFKLYQGILQSATGDLKTVSRQNIEAMSLELATMKYQIDSIIANLLELKAQISKEAVGFKQHSIMIHERSEKIRQLVDEAMAKVGRVLELKDKVDMTHGEVKVIDAKIERSNAHTRSNFQTVAETLGKHAVKISNLEKKEKP